MGERQTCKVEESKNIAIFGFGKEGISAANYLGMKNTVHIFDDKNKKNVKLAQFKKINVKNVQFHFAPSRLPNERFDIVVRSPGVRPDHAAIKHYLSRGATLTSPTNLFFENCPCNIIAVTGTKGKGTTSTLIYRILKKEKTKVFLAGNIGMPALEILPKLDKESNVILELSSFQLIDLKYSPHVAVVLMITTEHLDWHKSQKEYENSKQSIVLYQTKKDFAVINQDFPISKKMADLTPANKIFFSTKGPTSGVYSDDKVVYSNLRKTKKIITISQIPLPGSHNLQNICAAVAVADIYKVNSKKINNVLKSFRGLKHRLQLVKEVRGIKFYNDSYSTIPETTIAAIKSFDSPKILILGGSSKKSDFTNLARTISKAKDIKALLLIGEEAPRLKAVFKKRNLDGIIIEGLKNMEGIVKTALKVSAKGDNVLLSPACASFDMFENYEDRGEQFIKEVLKINEEYF